MKVKFRIIQRTKNFILRRALWGTKRDRIYCAIVDFGLVIFIKNMHKNDNY